MPYLLPEGEAYTDEISCYLVFAPKKDEYRRALAGSLVGLEVWNIWERDAEHRGRDAARAWKEANQLTFDCMDGSMVCLDALLEELIAIKILLSNQRDCCEIPFTYLPEEETDPPIIDPGVGDPPDSWGEEEIIDTWEDWEAYVCYYAHVYVDNLLGMADSLTTYAQLGAFAVMAIAGLLAIGAAVGFIIVVSYPAAAGIVTGLLLGATTVTFLDTRDEIEAARDSIVCAIMQNTGLGDAVEDALGSGLAWDLFFQFLNYNQALDVIYTGEYEGEYLEPLTDETCACADPGEFDITFTFDADLQAWIIGGSGTSYWTDSGNPAGSIYGNARGSGETNLWTLTDADLETFLGVSGVQFTIYELHWENKITVGATHALKSWIDYPNNLWTLGYSGYPAGTWEPVERPSGTFVVGESGSVVRFEHYSTHSGTWREMWIDNIRIVGRYD